MLNEREEISDTGNYKHSKFMIRFEEFCDFLKDDKGKKLEFSLGKELFFIFEIQFGEINIKIDFPKGFKYENENQEENLLLDLKLQFDINSGKEEVFGKLYERNNLIKERYLKIGINEEEFVLGKLIEKDLNFVKNFNNNSENSGIFG